MAQEPLRLENGTIGLSFDRMTGALVAIENKLACETYQVRGDECAVEAVEFRTAFADLKLAKLDRQGDVVKAQYDGGEIAVEATYTLHGENHFAEKQMTITCGRKCGLKKVVVSRPTFAGSGLQVFHYRYPKFWRSPGAEPECTFFGRTAKGGFFTGLESSFDSSTAKGNSVVLEFAPSLKMAAGEKLACEPVYFGVYRRGRLDKEENGLPLRSESDAMVAMTSTILGPPRFGLVPMANGWLSQMANATYTEQSVAADMKSLDVLKQCGIDWLSDSHPWGGETAKMKALGPDDKYEPGPLVCKFLAHARKVGVNVVTFTTLNNPHPWNGEKAFRLDQPDWLVDAGAGSPTGAPAWRKHFKGNCLGSQPFFNWIERIDLETLAGGRYPGWCADGDFFGGPGMGGNPSSVVPVNCQSDKHDHLPGDSNYVCQRALSRLMADIRKYYPRAYISAYRPAQDLGIWSLKNVDACFTLLETGTGPDNVVAGNDIRAWSRTRVHHNFFPHYIDQPLLFPWPAPGNWPGKKLDYILLSALSSSPNQHYYIPTKLGLPDQDKAEIRKWLDWGRNNIEYLKVRKDLPDWPAANKVDGSAHIVGDRGLIFLFNPSPKASTGEFALTEESIGLKVAGNFRITQEYPAMDRTINESSGKTVRWGLPPATAAVLRIQPAAE